MAWSLHGRLEDFGCDPVAGAAVELVVQQYATADSGTFVVRGLTASTDGAGSFSFEGLDHTVGVPFALGYNGSLLLRGFVPEQEGDHYVTEWAATGAASPVTETEAQQLRRLIQDGLADLQGPPGPANTLTIGTVATGAAGSSASAAVTGSAPNQTLNLVIPKGDPGSPGPANALAVGTVTQGAAAASITGSAPNQTLNLTLPAASPNTLAIGTVTQGTAAATITGSAPNQTLNLTLPKGDPGAPGSPTAYELRGAGSPYGSVTPASAGIYYTDTAGTTGAWRWMSTGTTNTSWVVVFGDTGWRNIFSVLTNVPAGISGAFGVRRIGGQVFVRTLLANANTAATTFSTAIPAGFGRVTTVGPQPYPAFIASMGRQDGTPYAINNNNNLAWGGSNMRIVLDAKIDLLMVPDGTFWHTSDAWPTTLPGSPA